MVARRVKEAFMCSTRKGVLVVPLFKLVYVKALGQGFKSNWVAQNRQLSVQFFENNKLQSKQSQQKLMIYM